MKLRLLLLALVSGALPLAASRASVNFSITVAPPVLAVYEQPVCPVEGYLWTPGYWAYDNGGYYWVEGVWVAPPRIGYLWTPPYWGFNNGFYAFNEGYWGPTVGFYGGVNYGYGYGGYGYDGGRWDGRVFRYNTAITRVDVRNIHNTYVDRTVIRRNNNRASFNGPGGVNARPDARQLAAANGRHAQPTSRQLAIRRTASQGRHVGAPAAGNGNGRHGRGQGNTRPTRQERTVTNPPGRGAGRGGQPRMTRQPQVQRQQRTRVPQVQRQQRQQRQVRGPQPGRGQVHGGGHPQQGQGQGKRNGDHH